MDNVRWKPAVLICTETNRNVTQIARFVWQPCKESQRFVYTFQVFEAPYRRESMRHSEANFTLYTNNHLTYRYTFIYAKAITATL